MTEANVADLLLRATFRTKAQVEQLVVELQPRPAPRDGIRRVAAAAAPMSVDEVPKRGAGEAGNPVDLAANSANAAEVPLSIGVATPPREAVAATPIAPRRVDIEPVARDRWSMRVTLDAEMKADLDLLASLASHAHGRDLAAVLHEAIRCAIEKLGKRKGAVEPSRAPAARAVGGGASGQRIAIPAEVRRQVWRRDGGRCAWIGSDGRRCESRHKLEFDHIEPVARGGASSVDNVRLLCRAHHALHAEQTFGLEHMARCRGAQLALG